MLRIALLFAFAAIAAALLAPGLMPDLVQNPAQAAPPPVKALASAPPTQNVSAEPGGSSGEIAIAADAGGQYSADVVINGQDVKMMVDTGATMVVISSRTAARLGVAVYAADYRGQVQTANGLARVASVTLSTMQVGPIALYNVNAWVLDGAASNVDLLGMSFLKRLASVEQKSGQLILRR
jgi:aspartyl protease family protein